MERFFNWNSWFTYDVWIREGFSIEILGLDKICWLEKVFQLEFLVWIRFWVREGFSIGILGLDKVFGWDLSSTKIIGLDKVFGLGKVFQLKFLV